MKDSDGNTISRSDFLSMIGAAALVGTPVGALSINIKNKDKSMYGLVGKIKTKEGERDALIEILLEGSADMTGCLSYIVSKDTEDDDIIWITEVWENQESHQASLSLPSVQQAMQKGRPLIADFIEQNEITPVGGHGLVSTDSK